ncbi:MAG: M16 family metallopeptidase [Vicinamibacterales bacterium]
MRPVACPGALDTVQPPDAWNGAAPSLVRTTLTNGLRVVLAENHTVPLAFLSWTSEAGFDADPPGLEGLASLTPLLLREGTDHRSSRRITWELDELGADLAAGADWNCAFLNLWLLSCDLAAGAELLLDMACRPRFSHDAVARLRQRQLAEIARRRRDPRSVANDAFAQALFGDAAYGRSPLGTAATVTRIAAADVTGFHRTHYRPETSVVVLAGSFDAANAVHLLGSFEPPEAPCAAPSMLVPAGPPAEPSGGVRLVFLPHATQAEIRVGHAGVARDCEHMAALEVLSAILGTGPASRLARALRQREGLTYQVRSRFAARRFGGIFVVETTVPANAAAGAVAGIRREIERLCDELVPPADVDHARRRLFSVELRRFQDLVGTGATLGPEALQDDPMLLLERRRQAIDAVDPEGLREVARRCLRPGRLLAVVVGPADALRPQFSSGGPPARRPVSARIGS